MGCLTRESGFFVMLLFAATLTAGDTLYVATDGNDLTGTGQSNNPWATITHALDNAPDGALILVKPGLYSGRTRLRGVFNPGITVRSEVPYQALLRHDSTVVTCYEGIGITLEGFDIAHDGPGANALVIQVQDLRGDPGGLDAVSQIIFRNNIIHDSFNNDLLKINNGAREVLVESNLFYNQEGSDEHMDINGVTDVEVRDNVFMNFFEGSGRPNNNDTSSFIVMKNSAGLPENGEHLIHRNIFLNWQGSSGSNFVLVGEDGHDFYEAENITVENNLFIGNSDNVMRAVFGVKGGRNITFRNNTISGNLPSLAYAMRLNREGLNPINQEIHFYNNIWSDPTETMGMAASGSNDFSDTPIGDTATFVLDHNLYWNGGAPIPEDGNELINFTDDPNRVIENPELPDQTGLQLPFWDDGFASGSQSIREEFERLAAFGIPGASGPIAGTANAAEAPTVDLLGNTRDDNPDMGAVELGICPPGLDLDTDGDIDLADLTLALPFWPLTTLLDLDADDHTTVLDFVLMQASFGSCGSR